VQALVCARDFACGLCAHGERCHALLQYAKCFCRNLQDVAETFFAGTKPPAFEQECGKLDSAGGSLDYSPGA
jgi:hypothetical protein